MRKFVKQNGENPTTTFQKGDIVVLECEGKDITFIMSFNRVENRRNGALFANSYLCIDLRGTTFFYCKDEGNWMNWHNGWVLRDATIIETIAFSMVYAIHSEKGSFEIHNVCP